MKTVHQVLAALTIMVVCAGACADPAFQHAVDIPALPLQQALNEFARQTGLQLVVRDQDVDKSLRSSELKGRFTIAEGLERLLANSGLRFGFLNDRTVAVRSARAGADQAAAGEQLTLHLAQNRSASAAGADSNGARPGESETNSAGPQEVATNEILVTAQKRSERLQDVPVPVAALSAETLVDNHQVRLQDYYSSVPGLSIGLDNRGAPSTAVRGITTTIYGNPTVGITINDVPFGASTVAAFSWAATDFDPNELSRIEVLRGPQGTLYGASSLGGLIKYETIEPSTRAFEGRLQASTIAIENGDGMGFGLSGAANLPLSDSFAVRVSGYTREDPGYVDNLLTGEQGANQATASGGRVAALWRASEDWSIKLGALLQHSVTDASPNIEPSMGDLRQSYIRGSGGYDKKLQAFDLTVRGKLGATELVAISGYGISTSKGSFDTTSIPFVSNTSLSFFGQPYTAWVEDNDTHKFSQEIRLTGSLSRFDWLVGGFYQDEDTTLRGGQYAFVGPTGQRLGAWYVQNGPVTYEETAGFVDLTYHFTERFDVQVGGRYGQNDQSYRQTSAFGSNPFSTSDTVRSDDSSVTYLLVPTLRLTPDAMIYARLASGYRPGGPNSAVLSVSTHPHTFGPDKTQNYEIGFKGQFLDRRLFVDASAYHIDWTDLQISLVDTDTAESWGTNLGRARSQGVDISVDVRPAQGLKIAAWVAWNDAKLAEDFPPDALSNGAAGAQGDRLPYSAEVSGNFSVQQDFPLGTNVVGFVGASLAYVGSREGEMVNGFGGTRQAYPSYTRTDLRFGANFAQWALNVYANNLTDERGVLAGGQQTLNPLAFTYIQPRTFGLAVTKTFR